MVIALLTFRVPTQYDPPSMYTRKWVMIHNFGQKTGMFGDLRGLAASALAAPAAAISAQGRAANASYKGIGLAPEGVHQNPVVYELATDMALSTAPAATDSDVSTWVEQYVQSRYGLATPPPRQGLPLEATSPSAAAAQEAWAGMTDRSVGGVYTTQFDVSGSGIINGGCSLRALDNKTAPLPPVAPPGHNATNECATWRALVAAATTATTATTDNAADATNVADVAFSSHRAPWAPPPL